MNTWPNRGGGLRRPLRGLKETMPEPKNRQTLPV